MSRPRLRGLPVVAGVLMVTGLALMLASLRIETTRESEVASDVASSVTTLATPIAVTGTPRSSEPKAARLVTRAQTAQRDLAYRGVKLVSRWNGDTSTSVVVTVDHAPGRGTVVVAGDADSAPGSSTAPAAALSDDATTAEETPLDPLDVLVRNYRLVSGDSALVADRTTDKVEAERADGTVAACFWIDRETGLVLRRELFAPDGRTIESSSYMRISVGPRVGGAATPTGAATPPVPSASPIARWTAMTPDDVIELRELGWPIPEVLEGGMALYSVHEESDAAAQVVQLGYTDGLVSISVFLQRGVLDRDALTGYLPLSVGEGQVWSRSSGAAPFYVWESLAPPVAGVPATGEGAPSRDIVVSATTDSPSAPVAAVVAALPAKPPPADGVGDRVSRGVDRVTSWFDPQE